MISARQQSANARNAQKSTGPATAEGRARSAKNATTHGLTTTGALLESEDAEAYARHMQAYRANHMPQDEQQSFLVTQMAEAAWRLRRVRKFENGILNADPTLATEGTLDKVCKLNRYEAAIERSYYRACRELEKLRATQYRSQRAALDAFIMAPMPGEEPEPAAEHPAEYAMTNRTHSQNRTPDSSLEPALQDTINRCLRAANLDPMTFRGVQQ